jgi:hypothetical protein
VENFVALPRFQLYDIFKPSPPGTTCRLCFRGKMIDFGIQTSCLYKTNKKLPQNITYRLYTGKKTQLASYESRKEET